MTKRRFTVTVDPDIADYLDGVENRSLVVSEAVREYCGRQLERELAAAYSEDREQAQALAAEWESADAELDE